LTKVHRLPVPFGTKQILLMKIVTNDLQPLLFPLPNYMSLQIYVGKAYFMNKKNRSPYGERFFSNTLF